MKLTLIRRGLMAFTCGGIALVTGCTDADPVQEQWESRDSLPSCGSLQLGQGESIRSDGKHEIACLRRARDDGRGAELRVRFPTVEGDPITEYYRVTPEGTTEVYTDATEDENSDERWHFAKCAEPETVLDVNC
jgi:hypothetical protein